jgi:hypothetical protein
VTTGFAVLALPQGAEAAVVQLRVAGEQPAVVANLQVTGLPGEANGVSVTRGGDGVLTVRDDGARLYSGENCLGGGAQVTCPVAVGAALHLTIATSDGADRVSLEALDAYGPAT